MYQKWDIISFAQSSFPRCPQILWVGAWSLLKIKSKQTNISNDVNNLQNTLAQSGDARWKDKQHQMCYKQSQTCSYSFLSLSFSTMKSCRLYRFSLTWRRNSKPVTHHSHELLLINCHNCSSLKRSVPFLFDEFGFDDKMQCLHFSTKSSLSKPLQEL